ncbi:MAG: DALR domain-containing protein, partial [Candidatus Anstonellales archaeon]
NGQKMSKSLGNYITIKDALSKYSPNVMRLFFITSSINSPIDFDEKNMKLAEANMRNIEEAYKSIETIINAIKQDETTMKKYKEVARIRKEIINIRREFIKSLEDNLNTPTALSHFYAFLKLINANINYIDRTTAEICMLFFREFSFITGIKFDKLYNKEREKKLVDMIINLRSVLRQKGFYELSDEIRKKLKDIDIEIYDEGNETKIRYL